MKHNEKAFAIIDPAVCCKPVHYVAGGNVG